MTQRGAACLLAIAVLVAWPAAGHAQASLSGFSVRYAVPYEAFADRYDRGWGVGWGSFASRGGTWASLGGGWTRFEPIDVPEGETSPGRLDQAELTFGMGIRSGQLHLGARAGYFFRDEDEWDLMPVASLRFGSLLVSAEAKVLGDVRWYGGSVSWLSR